MCSYLRAENARAHATDIQPPLQGYRDCHWQHGRKRCATQRWPSTYDVMINAWHDVSLRTSAKIKEVSCHPQEDIGESHLSRKVRYPTGIFFKLEKTSIVPVHLARLLRSCWNRRKTPCPCEHRAEAAGYWRRRRVAARWQKYQHLQRLQTVQRTRSSSCHPLWYDMAS